MCIEKRPKASPWSLTRLPEPYNVSSNPSSGITNNSTTSANRSLPENHAHAEAIGVVDESAVAKSGDDTVGVGRQWDGNRGKVDNCVVGVHLSYATPDFQCLLGSGVYLPVDWANDPARRKKTTSPRR